MTSAELKSAITDALADASTVTAVVEAQGYTTVADFEAAANTVRQALGRLIPLADRVWGVDSIDLVLQLRAVAARLLDLRALVVNSAETIVEAPERLTSLLQLATTAYGDHTRWSELLELNPTIPHPGFVSAGREVVRHAS